jgi:thiol-disulfide isomerase/thioredoxin
MRLQLGFLLFMAVTWLACQEEKPQIVKTGMEGKPLPAFNIQLLDGTSFIHSENLPGGKNLVLFYFKPTCPYCRAQMRDMLNNMERFKDKELCILTNEGLKGAKDFARYFKLNSFNNVIVGRDTGSVVLKTYRILGVPLTAYFDKNRQLKTLYSGRMRPGSFLQF